MKKVSILQHYCLLVAYHYQYPTDEYFSFLVPSERAVISKERAAGMYRLSAYYVAKSVSEIPLVVLQPVIFWTIVYWMAGLDSSVRFIASVLLLVLSTITAQVRELSLIDTLYRIQKRDYKFVRIVQFINVLMWSQLPLEMSVHYSGGC